MTVLPTNPFQMVWDALWRMAEANETLAEIVKLRNRIRYDEVLGPKREAVDSDFPELVLLSSGGGANIMNSSGTTKVERKYTWAISTAEYEINYYNLIAWELFRAMISWNTELCALEWPESSGWHFVVRTNVLDIDEGTIALDEHRNIAGWAGMWQIDVEMHFSTSTLLIS